MRIVIDLQSCQAGTAPTALAHAQDLARANGAADTFVALSNRYPATIEALRHAFAGLLPRAHVLVYDLPLAGTEWSEQAAAIVRRHFLATLMPDVVVGAIDETAPWTTVEQLDLATFALPANVTAARPKTRPRLAHISPLPPEKSGIADYSAELVMELSHFYLVELIVDQPTVSDANLTAHFPVRSLEWFEDHAHEFERVVYHFGNSGVHQHMFELIRRHPGIVVLHDFFLSSVLDNLERDGYLPQCYLRGLYESHGYSALADHLKIGRNPSIWKYPLNKGVLDHASGVIVHSDFSHRLADDWYGKGVAADWRTIPLLRGKRNNSDRAEARARLGLAEDDFVVATYGMLGRTKLNEELLDAFLRSPLASDPQCKLVFVGQNDPGRYGANLTHKMEKSAAAKRITVTGFVSAEAYADYLAASDCAVQLRCDTRGETSAAVLDCLLHGLPTIANAHGSTAEIPSSALLKLPDHFTCGQLADALASLRNDTGERGRLSDGALTLMREHHTPDRVGQQYHDAIEHFATHSRHSVYRNAIDAIASIAGHVEDVELGDAARAIAFNAPQAGQRQLFVDVSAMVTTDLKTGIQRVVRSVLLALIAEPPPGFRIEPVFSTGSNRSYQYARRYTLGMIGEKDLRLEDAPIDLRPGDVFLGLDLFTNGIRQNHDLLQSMRDRGAEIYFVVYDLLPVLRPDVFPFGTEQYFGDFLDTVATVADGVICISRAVADELATWYGKQPARRAAPLNIAWFHLGADLGASAPTTGLPAHAQLVFNGVASRPSFLMVGTVEPRKGHTQTLAAFELLWQQGVDVNLVIVGKQGWMMDKLAERMEKHVEKNKRLFWLPGVSDEMLEKLYKTTSALLSPSEGEGFGLPLIECAQHGVPIIARDLPVFCEVAGEHAHYFSGLEPQALADSIKAWLPLFKAGKAPTSTGMPWLTWRDSAGQLMNAVVRGQWYKTVPGEAK
ncbi:MAG: glycosyltransferase [Pseudomonadota bacterium]